MSHVRLDVLEPNENKGESKEDDFPYVCLENMVTRENKEVKKDNFHNIGDNVTHHIIDFLNHFDQHQLEQTSSRFKGLLWNPEHFAKRIELRAKGRHAKYQQQLILISSFLTLEKSEMEQKYFFSHLSKVEKKHGAALIMLCVGVLPFLIWEGILFNRTGHTMDQVKNAMDDAKLYAASDASPYPCSTILTTSRCDNDPLYDRNCLQLCQKYLSTAGDYETLGVSGAVVLIVILALLCGSVCRLRKAERSENFSMEQFSPKLQQIARDVIFECSESKEIRRATLQSSIGFFRTAIKQYESDLNNRISQHPAMPQ